MKNTTLVLTLYLCTCVELTAGRQHEVNSMYSFASDTEKRPFWDKDREAWVDDGGSRWKFLLIFMTQHTTNWSRSGRWPCIKSLLSQRERKETVKRHTAGSFRFLPVGITVSPVLLFSPSRSSFQTQQPPPNSPSLFTLLSSILAAQFLPSSSIFSLFSVKTL